MYNIRCKGKKGYKIRHIYHISLGGGYDKFFLKGEFMNIKPLFDRVIIEPDEINNTSKGGIVLPQTAQDRPQTGKVVAVGSGKDLENNDVGMQVNVGDTVIFNKYTGAEVKFKDKNYIILRQIDIIAVI